ncbi:MAG: hypothetical protein Kow0029_01920 [Candidatus Rifleibacteriota bacterium]
MKIRGFLESFLIAYESDPDRENESLFKAGKKIFGWRWQKESGKKSPVNILKNFKSDFEQSLFCEPLSLGQKAAETVILLTTVKQQLDIARLMREMGDEKQKALTEFDQTFQNSDIKEFLQNGTFLDVKGGSILDWFSQIYSSYDEMKKYLNLYRKDVEDYTAVTDQANSDTRERMLWFDKEVTHPAQLLRRLNSELVAWKDIVERFGEISADNDLNVILAEDSDFADKVFAEYGLEYELTPLDPADPIDSENLENAETN